MNIVLGLILSIGAFRFFHLLAMLELGYGDSCEYGCRLLTPVISILALNERYVDFGQFMPQ